MDIARLFVSWLRRNRWRTRCRAGCLGVLLPAVLGALAQPAPKLLSVAPPAETTNAAPRGAVVFVFDQPMDTAVPPLATVPNLSAGNFDFSPAWVRSQMTGRWGTDQRTLTFQTAGAIPLGAVVTWTLNPEGTVRPLRSATGQALATATGSFQIAPNAGGSPSERCPPVTPVPGTYTVSKLLQYIQSSGGDPILRPENLALFGVTVQGSKDGPVVVGGSVTLPGGSVEQLRSELGQHRLLEPYSTAAALESARPSGNYTLRIQRLGEPEHVIPLALPAFPEAIPKVANYSEAQAIDATKEFTLRWNAFPSSASNAVVRVVIADEFGNRIFLAPNPCVPRTLDPTASSLVIPANYLRPGFSYRGQLIFGLNFYRSDTDIGGMTGNGFVQRITSFSLRTLGGPGELPREWCPVAPPTTGSYAVVRLLSHRQIAPDQVVPAADNPAFLGVTLQSPLAGPAVAEGTLTLPDTTVRDLTHEFQFVTLAAPEATEADLDRAFPPGDYILRFTQTGLPEWIVPLKMPTAPSRVPRIVNFDAAQNLDATNEFTLEWEPFTAQGPAPFLQLIITDPLGNLVYLAPNPCVPRNLDPSATSVTIPSHSFRPGVAYEGALVFGSVFFEATGTIPQMTGRGLVQRTTTFPLRTRGPVTLSGFRILPNGNPEFQVAGPAGSTYQIQRGESLDDAEWDPLSPVTLDASGNAVFEDSDGALQPPAFYRAAGD